VLASCWIVTFTHEFIGGSLFVIFCMLFAAIVLFLRARHGVQWGDNPLIVIPFSIFFGWITVATLANLSVWLVSLGWNGGEIGAQSWNIILILLAAILGIGISIAFRDWIYPLVIAWAAIAISIENRNLYEDVANTGLLAGVSLVIWGAIYAYLRFSRRHTNGVEQPQMFI
jgi:translocator protein